MHIHAHGKDKANPGSYYFVVHGTYEEFASDMRPNLHIALEEAKLRYGLGSPSVRRQSNPNFLGKAAEVSARAPGLSEGGKPDGYLWGLPDHQVAQMDPYKDKAFQQFCKERRAQDAQKGAAQGIGRTDMMEQTIWIINAQ